jgi:predicted Abi (CAAX) family protease
MFKSILKDLIVSFKTPPFNQLGFTLLILIICGLLAFTIGFVGNIFIFKTLEANVIYILPFILFIFPSLLEELFFRGCLIPRSSFSKSIKHKIFRILISSIIFVLWHPFNAYFFNQDAQELFYNIYFLIIVFILGLSCGISYIISKSIWTPIIIHWLTVLVWIIFLGGINLINKGNILRMLDLITYVQ